MIIVERAFAVGAGGIVGQNVRLAMSHLPVTLYNVVAGLGGRPVTTASLLTLVEDVLEHRISAHALHFLDLDEEVVAGELARQSDERPGPHAESVLRTLGSAGARSH